MPWSTPTIEEIAMSAEIGAYQEDFDGDAPRFAEPRLERTASRRAAPERPALHDPGRSA